MLCPNPISYGGKPHDIFGPDDIDWRCSDFGPSKPKPTAQELPISKPKPFSHDIDWKCYSKRKSIAKR